MSDEIPEGVTPFGEWFDRDSEVFTVPDDRSDVPPLDWNDSDDVSVRESLEKAKLVLDAVKIGMPLVESIVKASGNAEAVKAVAVIGSGLKVAGGLTELVDKLERRGTFDPYKDVPINVPTDGKSEPEDDVLSRIRRLAGES